MKGLLAKDFALMKQRGKMMIFLIAWGALMKGIMDDAGFVTGWMVMIATISGLGSISYDEYDNCMPFLMSLPVTRRTYAVEKYVFAGLCGFIAWVFGLVIEVVGELVMGRALPTGEDILSMVVFLAIMVSILSVTIPPQLKWGAEKGRIVMIILFGVVCVGIVVIQRLGGMAEKPAFLDRLTLAGGLLIGFATAAVMAAVSVALSVRIMEKKEF